VLLQAALNATTTSSLAMHMTSNALTASANEETNELLHVLTQVRAICKPMLNITHPYEANSNMN
jgi:hypothetical protein